jgi:hypothetical protein
MDKARCWKALELCVWYNDHSDFFYRHVHGDKETFHLAFRKVDQRFSMPSTPAHRLNGAVCQHDFEGHRIWQHRFEEKWRFHGDNPHVRGFRHEARCRGYLEQLHAKWDGRILGARDGASD